MGYQPRKTIADYVSRPPTRILKLALELDVLNARASRQALCGADVIAIEKARVELHAKLVEYWPLVNEMLWRSMGKWMNVEHDTKSQAIAASIPI